MHRRWKMLGCTAPWHVSGHTCKCNRLVSLSMWQLMVASTVDDSYVHCGEMGGSVVNALHLGKDPRGEGHPLVPVQAPHITSVRCTFT